MNHKKCELAFTDFNQIRDDRKALNENGSSIFTFDGC